MSSWSDCYITFRGKKETIDEIVENIEKNGLNWGATKIPKELEDSSERFEWMEKKWGMEWNITEEEAIPTHYAPLEKKGMSEVKFSIIGGKTGPYKWFEKVCQQYGVSGKYVNSSPSSDFFIEIVYEGGKKTKDEKKPFISRECLEYYDIEEFKELYNDEMSNDPDRFKELKPILLDISKGTPYEEDMKLWIDELGRMHGVDRTITVAEAMKKGMLVYYDEANYFQVFYDEKNNQMDYTVGMVSKDYELVMREGDFVDKEGAIEEALRDFEKSFTQEEESLPQKKKSVCNKIGNF